MISSRSSFVIRRCGQIRRLASAAGANPGGPGPSDRDRWRIGRAAAAVAAAVGGGVWLAPSSLADSPPNKLKAFVEASGGKSPRFLFGESFRKRVFFNYEKRMRLLSPPEKIFEYFASLRSPGGEVLMSPADLMRAVIPVFPPSESHIIRGGHFRGERNPGTVHCAPSSLFMLFDTNNDGLISFPEYIFFVTLLSIPESSFSVAFKMFDRNNSGEIESKEFKKVMEWMRSHNRQGAHSNGLRFGRRVHKSVEKAGVLEYFFGKDGKQSIKYEKFVQFLRDLHDEILRLEFDHYDFKSRGSISAKDFALSMVASADVNHINKFLDRVDELNDSSNLSNIRITFEVCGVSLTDNVVDVVFHVFDANRDGNLSAEEFLRAMQKKGSDIRQPTLPGIMGLLACVLNRSETELMVV